MEKNNPHIGLLISPSNWSKFEPTKIITSDSNYWRLKINKSEFNALATEYHFNYAQLLKGKLDLMITNRVTNKTRRFHYETSLGGATFDHWTSYKTGEDDIHLFIKINL